MHGVNRFLYNAFANGNQGNKISWPCKSVKNLIGVKRDSKRSLDM